MKEDNHEDRGPVAILFDVDGCLISTEGPGPRRGGTPSIGCTASRPTSASSPKAV